ncbi:hypothetical protein L3Q82_020004 [Scortum barcoo]|uniref:Uncharacterized protein n=1 Tax=Scortum barcoo TaxID=214431 RepID=A0ACB8VDE5_9TELE|nr:hypothetical protein L3Q82_020004 [Scortum barcoo]
MHKRWIRRRLPILIFTFFIILYVDFQLRTGGDPKLGAVRPPPPGALPRSIQQAPSAAKDAHDPAGNSRSSSLGGEAEEEEEGAHVTSQALKLEDIFIAVKTTGRFHGTRLALLLETWISRTRAHTYIFTDMEDEDLRSEGHNMVVTSCQSDHSQQALSCKMSAEYDGFMASDKRWFCHVDDDNYVNPEALLSLLSAFPQDGDIYVGKPSLDKPITAHELLENNATYLSICLRNGGEFADKDEQFIAGCLEKINNHYESDDDGERCCSLLFRVTEKSAVSFCISYLLQREVRFWFATGGAGFCLSRRLAEKMAPWASGSRFEQTSATIRLPDDCTVGFIVEKRLGVSMVHCPLFHSHLENLLLIRHRSIPHQVTLSYGMFENKMNSIEVKGSFSKEDDPSSVPSAATKRQQPANKHPANEWKGLIQRHEECRRETHPPPTDPSKPPPRTLIALDIFPFSCGAHAPFQPRGCRHHPRTSRLFFFVFCSLLTFPLLGRRCIWPGPFSCACGKRFRGSAQDD